MTLPNKGLVDPDNARIWWDIAQRFTDGDLNIVRVADFGEPDSPERKKASPKVSYLTSRTSENMRIRLGLSERREDAIYGAVVRRKLGVYEWQPNTRWPAFGELWDRSDFNGMVPSKVRKQRESILAVQNETPSPAVASNEAPGIIIPSSDVKIIAREGNTLIISNDGKIIVAEIKTEASL